MSTITDVIAFDRLPDWLKPKLSEKAFGNEVFAFDDAMTVRSYDDVGRLHIKLTPISKAGVSPYRGREIPKYIELGLDPEKVYMMLRDPQELERAAHTFNGMQFLDKHIPVNVKQPQLTKVIGATGTEAVYQHPYLMNSLIFWTEDALGDVEQEIRKQLSSGYRYDADMTPGQYEGKQYDGVMRNIRGNHLALVKTGRVGPDVLVHDEKPKAKEYIMPKTVINKETVELSPKATMVMGMLHTYLTPMMAADEAVPDLTPLLKGVTHDNYKEQRVGIAEVIRKSVGGKLKLAEDADLDTLDDALMALDELPEPAIGKKMPHAAIGKDEKGKDKHPADCTCKDCASARDAARSKEGGMDVALDEETIKKHGLITQDVLQEHLDQDRARSCGVFEALRVVRPYVGELAMDEFDDAPEVYKYALDTMKVDVKDIHPSAYRKILEMQPKPGEKTTREHRRDREHEMATDEAADFDKLFPEVSRIGLAG